MLHIKVTASTDKLKSRAYMVEIQTSNQPKYSNLFAKCRYIYPHWTEQKFCVISSSICSEWFSSKKGNDLEEEHHIKWCCCCCCVPTTSDQPPVSVGPCKFLPQPLWVLVKPGVSKFQRSSFVEIVIKDSPCVDQEIKDDISGSGREIDAWQT